MVKTILFYILSIFSFILSGLEACEIISHHRIIRTQFVDLNFKDIAKSTDCNTKEKLQFLNAIQNSKGVLNPRIFKNDLGVTASIKPAKIKVEVLEENLINRFNLTSKWTFRNTHAIGQATSIVLSEGEKLSYDCLNCTIPGEKSIKVIIRDAIKGTEKFKWIKSSLLTRSYALVSTTDFHVDNKPLSFSNFKLQEVFSATPEVYFTKKNKLRFYKLNKVLRKGKPIEFSTLSPVSLVSIGNPVSVSLRYSTLSLQGKAIPMKNGFYGELIQLRNIQTNKIIIGKVVDFNKVVIEL